MRPTTTPHLISRPRPVPGTSTSGPPPPIAPPTAAGPGRMKFAPIIPMRRPKIEPGLVAPSAAPALPQGRVKKPPVKFVPTIVASGPFAKPVFRDSNRKVNQIQILPEDPSMEDKRPAAAILETVEQYSDNEADAGGRHATIIDLSAIRSLHPEAPIWVGKAPLVSEKQKKKLKREKTRRKLMKKELLQSSQIDVKKEETTVKKEQTSPQFETTDLPPVPGNAGFTADQSQHEIQEEGEEMALNALDLSDSDVSEYEEYLGYDFGGIDDQQGERMLFFQFPQMWPTFAASTSAIEDDNTEVDPHEDGSTLPSKKTKTRKKSVTFASDSESKKEKAKIKNSHSKSTTKREDLSPEDAQLAAKAELRNPKPAIPVVDGMIGEVVVTKSGKVQMILGNGLNTLILDITAGAQSSFAQQIVHLPTLNDFPSGEKDLDKGKTFVPQDITVLGNVDRKFVASVNVDHMLLQVGKEDAHGAFSHRAAASGKWETKLE